MKFLKTTMGGTEVEIVNTMIVEDEICNTKSHCVLAVDKEEDEHWVDGDIVFEARFDNPEDAQELYELLRRAQSIDLA